MSRVRIRTRPTWENGEQRPGSLLDGHEGDLVDVGVDAHGIFALVVDDDDPERRRLRFELGALEAIGGEP